MGPADSRGISRVPRYSGTAWNKRHGFAYGALTLCGGPFQGPSATVTLVRRRRPYYPGRGHRTAPVWAAARSLAATGAIVVTFFSCGYLDVSVPRVRPPRAFAVWRRHRRRVAPFGNPRVAGHLPLAAAYRSLSRPSSPPGATGIPRAPLSAFVFAFYLSLQSRLVVSFRLCSHSGFARFSRSISLAFDTFLEVLRSQHVKDLFYRP